MGGSPSPPPVPDPAGVSAGQLASNLAAGESAQAGSQVNQIGPTGAVTYYQTGVGPNGVPTYTAVNQLTPQQQMLLNLQQEGMGLSGGAGANLMANSFNQYSQNPNNFIGNQTSGLEGQQMGEWLQAQAPWMQLSHDQLNTQLLNQGLDPNSPAYKNAMNQLNQSQMNAVAGAASQFEPTAFGQAVQQYSLPLQTAQSLMAFNSPGNVNLPETGQAPNYAPPNVISAVANSQQALEQNYQSQIAQQNAMWQNILGFGQGILGMGAKPSDIRLKKDIKIHQYLHNHDIWIFRWKYTEGDGTEYTGPMAQSVKGIYPEAVTEHDGYLYLIQDKLPPELRVRPYAE